MHTIALKLKTAGSLRISSSNVSFDCSMILITITPQKSHRSLLLKFIKKVHAGDKSALLLCHFTKPSHFVALVQCSTWMCMCLMYLPIAICHSVIDHWYLYIVRCSGLKVGGGGSTSLLASFWWSWHTSDGSDDHDTQVMDGFGGRVHIIIQNSIVVIHTHLIVVFHTHLSTLLTAQTSWMWTI
jgi:hypothetical protein